MNLRGAENGRYTIIEHYPFDRSILFLYNNERKARYSFLFLYNNERK